MHLNRYLACLASAFVLAVFAALPAAAKPPLEAFGNQPTTRAGWPRLISASAMSSDRSA